MLQIKPVSDLRNKFANIEKIVSDGIERALDQADRVAEESSYRVTHEEGFANLRRRLHE